MQGERSQICCVFIFPESPKMHESYIHAKFWRHKVLNISSFLFSVVSEPLERLLQQRFMYDKNVEIPNAMLKFATSEDEILDDGILTQSKEVFSLYNEYLEQIRSGGLGKTAQYWLIYLDLIRMLHVIHTAVQENDFQARVFVWEYFIPFFFAFNKMNYSRYGSFYLQTLKSIDSLYPGMKELLEYTGLSVQGQDKYPLRISVDQRGEQTINRDAKTTGGIKAFSTLGDSVSKWCLNRAEQARNTRELQNLCGLSTDTGIYKPCRPSQIIKCEKLVQSTMRVLMEEYINPFDIFLEKDMLINLSSGMPLNEEATDFLLSSPTLGQEDLYKQFVEDRLKSGKIPVHDPIKRLKIKSFKTAAHEPRTTQKKSVDVNRDILAKLLSMSCKKGKTIDFEKALKYPLGDVPLSLCNGDGSTRKTNKSKLAQIIISRMDTSTTPDVQKERTAYIVDVMVLIRMLSGLPDTFERLAWKMLSCIPKGYYHVDLVADCYFKNSIKDAERSKRGKSGKIIVRSSQSKIPGDFASTFLSNGENKTRMIELLFETIERGKDDALDVLRCDEIILSREGDCKRIRRASVTPYFRLLSTQEEADTKVIAHAVDVFEQSNGSKIVLRSPSGVFYDLHLETSLSFACHCCILLKKMYCLTMELVNQENFYGSEI